MEVTADFNFFQAIRLLKRGSNKPIRFKADKSSLYYERDIVSLNEQTKHWEITLSFMLLAGSSGIMPDEDFTQVQRSAYSKQNALFDLINLLNHHLIQTFYQAWQYHQVTIQKERLRKLISEWLALQNTDLIAYSDLLLQQPISLQALTQLLNDYFNVPVQIEENTGEWLPIHNKANHNQLGINTLIGNHYWNASGKFTIHIGPLSFKQYSELLPGEKRRTLLGKITSHYTPAECDYTVKLKIKLEEIPALQLSSDSTLQLGRHTWLAART